MSTSSACWLSEEVILDLYSDTNTHDPCEWSCSEHVLFLLPCVHICVLLLNAEAAHTQHTYPQPLSSSCAFQGLKRGFVRVQAVGQCVFLTHRFQELSKHVLPLQIPPGERQRTPASCFPLSAHVAMRPQPSCWAAQWARVWFSFQQACYRGLHQRCLIVLSGPQ